MVRAAAGWERRARFTAFLYAVARNLAVDEARRAAFRATDPLPGGDQRWGCIGTFIAVLGLLCLGVFLFLLLAGAAVVAVV